MEDVENISFQLLLRKTKPIPIAIKKETPTRVFFLEFCKISKSTFSYRTHPMADFGVNAFYLVENDLFILVVSNINILGNGNNILEKYKDIPKKYEQIWPTLGLKQLKKGYTKRCYQHVPIWPSVKTKTSNHKQISFRTFTNYGALEVGASGFYKFFKKKFVAHEIIDLSISWPSNFFGKYFIAPPINVSFLFKVYL